MTKHLKSFVLALLLLLGTLASAPVQSAHADGGWPAGCALETWEQSFGPMQAWPTDVTNAYSSQCYAAPAGDWDP